MDSNHKPLGEIQGSTIAHQFVDATTKYLFVGVEGFEPSQPKH